MRTLPVTLPSATLLGTEIKPVTVAKDLGVYIDSHLNYNEHIIKTVFDCIHKLTRLNRIKHLLDQKTLIFLINAFVFSKLFYCSTVWSNTSKENVGKLLQSVQNYACRIVGGLRKFDHISGALKSLKWLKWLKDKLLFNDLVMVRKCLNNFTPSYLRFQRRSIIHLRNTMQKNDLELLKCRLKTGQRSFAYSGAKLFNDLPRNIRETNDLNLFKKRIFKHILNL